MFPSWVPVPFVCLVCSGCVYLKMHLQFSPNLHDSRIFPNELLASWLILASLLIKLTGLVKHGRRPLPYLEGGPCSTRSNERLPGANPLNPWWLHCLLSLGPPYSHPTTELLSVLLFASQGHPRYLTHLSWALPGTQIPYPCIHHCAGSK